jgi:hypothetical protein
MDKQASLAFNRENIAEFRSTGGRIASFGDASPSAHHKGG